MDNKNIPSYNNLKKLVQEKTRLEKIKQDSSYEYKEVNNKIHLLMNNANINDLKVIENSNNIEIKNMEYFFNSDIETAQRSYMSEKLQTNYAINSIVKEKMQDLNQGLIKTK